jgi:thiol-disulfide isomerase/thioredoxin
MKLQILTLSLIFTASISFAQNRTVHFESTPFSEIKAKAKKENKLIFVDAFTTWCGPCKWMAANIFTNDTVADYYNARFINAQIDMEKGEGPGYAALYEVFCYPNLLFIDGDGMVVHRGAGASDAQSFIQLATDALNPEKCFSKFRKEYESGNTDATFIIQYLDVISRTCLPFNDIVTNYFNSVGDEGMTSRANWNMILNYSSDYRAREFVYLLKNIEAFNKLYSADTVGSKIKDVLITSGYNIINNPESDDDEYLSYKNEISNLGFSGIEEVLFHLDMSYFYRKQNFKKFVELAVENADKYYKDIASLNRISWVIFENSDDVAALQKAESWMKKGLEESQSQEWAFHDTYASLLFKLNKKAEAKAAAIKAIEFAKAAGVNEEEYQPTVELLEKIEKMN